MSSSAPRPSASPKPAESVQADNILPARLESVTLLGPVIRLSLTCRNLPLVADVNTSERSRFARGEDVLVCFQADACRVMRVHEE